MLSKHSTTEIHLHPLVFYGKTFKFCSLVYFETYVIVNNIYLSLWYISKLSPPPYIEIFPFDQQYPIPSLPPHPLPMPEKKIEWQILCAFFHKSRWHSSVTEHLPHMCKSLGITLRTVPQNLLLLAYIKLYKVKGFSAGGETQLLECLPSQCKALCSNSGTIGKKIRGFIMTFLYMNTM
jgi:hypothetical protein